MSKRSENIEPSIFLYKYTRDIMKTANGYTIIKEGLTQKLETRFLITQDLKTRELDQLYTRGEILFTMFQF